MEVIATHVAVNTLLLPSAFLATPYKCGGGGGQDEYYLSGAPPQVDAQQDKCSSGRLQETALPVPHEAVSNIPKIEILYSGNFHFKKSSLRNGSPLAPEGNTHSSI